MEKELNVFKWKHFEAEYGKMVSSIPIQLSRFGRGNV
jgi:hypothetical protein